MSFLIGFIVFAVILSQMMARKGRRRSPLVVIKFNALLSLATLGSGVALKTALLPTLTSDLYIASIDALWGIHDLTATEGPIEVGFNHGAYTVGEITEGLDESPTGRNDVIALERTRRKVRRAGQFSGVAAEETLNDGKRMRRKIGFQIDSTEELEFFVVNRSGSTLTTGAVVHCSGQVYGYWR